MKADPSSKENTGNRRLILETAKRLYYERGMEDVSFDEIADICGVTKSLIRYHFRSKAKLANELFGTYSKEQANVFFRKAYALGGSYSNIDILDAYSILCLRYYCADEKALRFYTQLFSCSFTDISYGIEDFCKVGGRQPQRDDLDYHHMIYIGSQYAARGLIYHYATGEIKCDEKTFAKYYIGLSKAHIQDEAERERSLDRAYEILERVSISFEPCFVWA